MSLVDTSHPGGASERGVRYNAHCRALTIIFSRWTVGLAREGGSSGGSRRWTCPAPAHTRPRSRGSSREYVQTRPPHLTSSEQERGEQQQQQQEGEKQWHSCTASRVPPSQTRTATSANHVSHARQQVVGTSHVHPTRPEKPTRDKVQPSCAVAAEAAAPAAGRPHTSHIQSNGTRQYRLLPSGSPSPVRRVSLPALPYFT